MKRLLQSSSRPEDDAIDTLISECVAFQRQIVNQRLAAVAGLPEDRQLWAKQETEEVDVVDLADRQLALLATSLTEFEARFRPRKPFAPHVVLIESEQAQ